MEKWEAKAENNDIRLSMLGLRRKLHQFQSSLFLLGKKSHRKRSLLLLRRLLFFSVQPQMESRGKCFGKSGKRTRRLCFVSGVPEILDVKAFQHQTLSLLLPRRIHGANVHIIPISTGKHFETDRISVATEKSSSAEETAM